MEYIIAIGLSLYFVYIADKYKQELIKIEKKIEVNRREVVYEEYLKFDNKQKKYCIYCLLAFIPPFIISALRDYRIGTDTSGTYYEIYKKALNNEGIRDFGYYILNKLCMILSENYTMILLITSLIICGVAYNRIFKESKHVVLSTYLFFATNVYFISMNMIRQSLAIMIFLLAIPYIRERKFWKYSFMIFIAFSFHSSGILYLPLYFMYNIKIDPKKIIIILASFLILGSFIDNIIYFIFKNISYLNHYFSWYFTSNYNTGEFNIMSFLISITVIGVLIYIYKEAKNDRMYNLIVWLELISAVLLSLSSVLPLMQRTSWLFSFPLFLYLPNMIDFIKNEKVKKVINIGVIIGYGLYMFITIFIMKYNEVFPYYSIF